MSMLRKLSQPLFWPHQFCIGSKLLQRGWSNSRKVIPLNVIIANNSDIYEDIKKVKPSSVEWQSIRERCLKLPNVTPSIVDSTIIDMCLTAYMQIDNAIAYFKFLRDSGYSLNAALIGRYLRLYVLKRDLNDEDKAEILETYSTLREKYQILDAVTAEHCITSLCRTDQWEKSFELLEMIKITTIPGNTVYSALAAAAFQNGKPDVAWKLMSKIMLRDFSPKDIVYTLYLSYCEQQGKEAFNENMVKMFDFWAEYSIIPHNKIMNAYLDAAGNYGWSGKATTISKTGQCEHCGQFLSSITISDEIFRKLVESMMNEGIIGSDIYYKSNPQELKNFKKFIEETKPYDVIIDGLNVYHATKQSMNMILEVISYFKQFNKKILVLTRKHQRKLPDFRRIEREAAVFYTNNLSADDPYMLYATMVSGKDAVFVSMDLMRQHKHSLKNSNLHREFKKWQFSHQYFVKNIKSGFYIQKPFLFPPIAQTNGNYWHVPYTDNYNAAESYEFPSKWYCLRHQTK